MADDQRNPPAGQQSPGTVSPDGAWMWNGAQWVPNAPVQPMMMQPAYVMAAPSKSHTGLKIAGFTCLGIVILLVAIAALGLFGVNQAVNAVTSPPAVDSGCAPAPCAVKDGFEIDVTGVDRNVPPGQFATPEAGNHYVVVHVRAVNHSSSSEGFNPLDFSLIDSAGAKHSTTVISDAPDCEIWSAVDVAPGGHYGPKSLCFEASGPTSAALKLAWAPALVDEVDIPLQ